MENNNMHAQNIKRFDHLETEVARINRAAFGHMTDDGVWVDGLLQQLKGIGSELATIKKMYPLFATMVIFSGINMLHSIGPDAAKIVIDLMKAVH